MHTGHGAFLKGKITGYIQEAVECNKSILNNQLYGFTFAAIKSHNKIGPANRYCNRSTEIKSLWNGKIFGFVVNNSSAAVSSVDRKTQMLRFQFKHWKTDKTKIITASLQGKVFVARSADGKDSANIKVVNPEAYLIGSSFVKARKQIKIKNRG